MSSLPDESDQEPPQPHPVQQDTKRSHRWLRGRTTGSRRVAAPVGLAVAAALAAAAWSVPPVHTVLLQSFTRQPSPYTELYFTSSPSFDGSTVIVPVSVNDHGTGANSYQVRVTLESPSREVVATTTVNLKPHDGSPVPVVARLRTNADVALLQVSLPGHPQTLHFSFENAQTPDPKGTA